MCRASMQRLLLCRSLHEGLWVRHKVGACIALQQPAQPCACAERPSEDGHHPHGSMSACSVI